MSKRAHTAKWKRPTQLDIARAAGVSQSTVSQVLRGNSSVAIPEETRQRVIETVKKLGYVPHRAAQSLRTRKSYTIACVIPNITNPFYPAVERGIQNVVDAHDYDLIAYNSDGSRAKELKILESIQQGRVDGVVGVFFHLNARDLSCLTEADIGVVRLEAVPKKTGVWPIDNLYVNNIVAACVATTYLIQKGHQHIAMLTATPGPEFARVEGYKKALRQHGLAPHVVQGSGYTESGGREAMLDLLGVSPRPSAVFAANDLMAVGALLAARQVGVSVPRDIAVLGFDDIPIARLVSPPLTTVAQHQEELGTRAASMLFERLEHSALGGGRNEEVSFDLVIRESA